MSNIQFTFLYNRKKKLNRNGEALIQIRAYHPKQKTGSNRKFFSTDVYVAPTSWNSKSQIIINHPNEQQLNIQINDKLQSLRLKQNDIFNRFGKCTLSDLDRDISYAYLSFDEFVKDDIDKSMKTHGTKKNQKATLTKLKNYRSQIHFGDLNFDFVQGFDRFLKRQDLASTSLFKHHKDLKYFINQAIRKGMLKNNDNPYIKFKPKRGNPKKRVFLEMYEIQKLEELTFEPHELHLGKINDLFLMGCYTGLRFGDLMNLKGSNFKETKDGILLSFVSEKSKKPLELELSLLFPDPDTVNDKSRPEQIYLKYLDYNKKIYGRDYKSKYIFSGITSQYVNREIKTLATRASINKKYSFHCSRHTFGCNMAVRVAVPVLQELMQHSKIETTMIYVHLSAQMVKTSLKNIQW